MGGQFYDGFGIYIYICIFSGFQCLTLSHSPLYIHAHPQSHTIPMYHMFNLLITCFTSSSFSHLHHILIYLSIQVLSHHISHSQTNQPTQFKLTVKGCLLLHLVTETTLHHNQISEVTVQTLENEMLVEPMVELVVGWSVCFV